MSSRPGMAHSGTGTGPRVSEGPEMHMFSQVILVHAGGTMYRCKVPSTWPSLGCGANLTHALGVLGPLRAFLISCCPCKLLWGPFYS